MQLVAFSQLSDILFEQNVLGIMIDNVKADFNWQQADHLFHK